VVGGPFQSVAVPAGRTTVVFTYRPPWALASVGAAAGALLVLIAWSVVPVVRARRRNGTADVAGGGPVATGGPDGGGGDAI
jgi:hypothetical protein